MYKRQIHRCQTPALAFGASLDGFLDAKYWLAIEDDRVVGSCGLYFEDDPTEGWMGWFGVAAGYRKNGYGDTMLNHVERQALKKGASRLSLWTGKSNTTAHKFYQARGFKLVGSNDTGKLIYSKRIVA